jgi:hypothetical protein
MILLANAHVCPHAHAWRLSVGGPATREHAGAIEMTGTAYLVVQFMTKLYASTLPIPVAKFHEAPVA